MRVENGDIEETLRLVHRVRAEAAVSKLRAHARRAGASRMPLADINAEIRAVRRQRHIERRSSFDQRQPERLRLSR
jgi:hypothetical protein